MESRWMSNDIEETNDKENEDVRIGLDLDI
jgi:hypothetical protein